MKIFELWRGRERRREKKTETEKERGREKEYTIKKCSNTNN